MKITNQFLPITSFNEPEYLLGIETWTKTADF